MPTSNISLIPEVLSAVMDLNPKSILDAGCGFGKYGVLFREYMDIQHGRYHPYQWKTKIDALEIYEDYITPIHKYVYDVIRIEDIRDFVGSYDLIFLGDIIEHLEKKVALKLLKRLRKTSNLIITTPNGYYVQGPFLGNEHEIHKCGFTAEDFKEFNAKVYQKGIMLMVKICQKN